MSKIFIIPNVPNNEQFKKYTAKRFYNNDLVCTLEKLEKSSFVPSNDSQETKKYKVNEHGKFCN